MASLACEKFHGEVPAAVAPDPLHAFEVALRGPTLEEALAGACECVCVRVALHRYQLDLRSHSARRTRPPRSGRMRCSCLGSMERATSPSPRPGSPAHVYCSDLEDCVVVVRAWERRLRELALEPSARGGDASASDPLQGLPLAQLPRCGLACPGRHKSAHLANHARGSRHVRSSRGRPCVRIGEPSDGRGGNSLNANADAAACLFERQRDGSQASSGSTLLWPRTRSRFTRWG